MGKPLSVLFFLIGSSQNNDSYPNKKRTGMARVNGRFPTIAFGCIGDLFYPGLKNRG